MCYKLSSGRKRHLRLHSRPSIHDHSQLADLILPGKPPSSLPGKTLPVLAAVGGTRLVVLFCKSSSASSCHPHTSQQGRGWEEQRDAQSVPLQPPALRPPGSPAAAPAGAAPLARTSGSSGQKHQWTNYPWRGTALTKGWQERRTRPATGIRGTNLILVHTALSLGEGLQEIIRLGDANTGILRGKLKEAEKLGLYLAI